MHLSDLGSGHTPGLGRQAYLKAEHVQIQQQSNVEAQSKPQAPTPEVYYIKSLLLFMNQESFWPVQTMTLDAEVASDVSTESTSHRGC